MKKSQDYVKTLFEMFFHPLNSKTKSALMLGLLASVVIFNSCKSDDDNGGKAVYDPDKPIVLTSFAPDFGRISEMVLLDGENFGTDKSLIKVHFNEKEASVINSTGKRILALVPRLPGDTCIISVQIGEQKKQYVKDFLYRIEASVTTLAGTGNADGGEANDNKPIFDQGLDKAAFRPVYIGADKDFNIFVTDTKDNLLRLNEADNSITVLATGSQGLSHRCAPYVNPQTNIIQMGSEGDNNRDRFVFLDPMTGWTPKMKFIKEWDTNGKAMPTNMIHYACILCEEDGNYYTRYNSGQLVRIDPKTWKATIVGMLPAGIAYGVAMHPINKNEMWIAYSTDAGNVNHSICKVDVLSDSVNVETNLLASFQKLSGATNGAHRDGPLSAAQFKQPRMINFDSDGNLYVGDNENHCIRMINTNTMMVETIIGIPEQSGFKDGAKDEALFKEPHGIVTDADNIIYVSDFGNNRIRRIAIE